MARTIAVAVAAVVVALFVGCGGGDDSQDYVSPGSDALTDRQTEMVDVAEDYAAAWAATDGDAVASFMTTNGVVEYPEDGWTFSVSDGSLQSRVTNGPYDSLRTLDPMLVYGHRIVLTGRIDLLDLAWLSVVEFTTAGDVQIVSETIYHWPSLLS